MTEPVCTGTPVGACFLRKDTLAQECLWHRIIGTNGASQQRPAESTSKNWRRVLQSFATRRQKTESSLCSVIRQLFPFFVVSGSAFSSGLLSSLYARSLTWFSTGPPCMASRFICTLAF